MRSTHIVVVSEYLLVSSSFLVHALDLLPEEDSRSCPRRCQGRRRYRYLDEDNPEALTTKDDELVKLLQPSRRHMAEPDEVAADAIALLKDGADPNFCMEGEPVLVVSLQRRNEKLVRAFIEYGADVNHVTSDQDSAIMISLQMPWPKATNMILDAKADLSLRGRRGATALLTAVQFDASTEVLRSLLARGGEKQVNVPDDVCRPPLCHAAATSSLEAMKVLLEFRADVNYIDTACSTVPKEELRAPLHCAVASESPASVKFLLEAHANASIHIGESDDRTNTPLHDAAGCKGYSKHDDLFDKGPRRSDSGRLAEDQRAWFSRIAQLLLRAGADVNLQNKDGDIPLMCALRHGLFWMSSKLAMMSNISLVNNANQTPLFMVLYPTVVHTLVDHKAELEHRDKDGNTPLLEAARRGRSNVVMALLSRGADVTAKTQDGEKLGIEKLSSFDEETLDQIVGKERWAPLHWAAFTCDAYAAGVAIQQVTDDKGRLTKDWGSLTKENKTAYMIADERKSLCPGVFRLLDVLEAQWRQTQQRKEEERLAECRSVVAALVFDSGSCLLTLLISRFQSLRQRGRIFFSVLPASIFGASIAIVLANRAQLRTIREIPEDEVQLNTRLSLEHASELILVGEIGCLTALAMMLLALSATVCGRMEKCLVTVKRLGFTFSERFWERLDLMLNFGACAIVFWLECKSWTGDAFTLGTSILLSVVFALGFLQPESTRSLRLGAGCVALVWGICNCLANRDWMSVRPATVVLIFYNIVAAFFDARGSGDIGHLPGVGPVDIELSIFKARSDKFTASKFIMGKAELAAHGLESALGLGQASMSEGLRDGLAAMEQEIVNHGDFDDLDNFNYIVHGTSGDPDDIPAAVAASLQSGQYHGGTIGPNDFDTGHDGRCLKDWMKLEEVQLARLTEAEFVAVRLYTSSSFRRINDPLRKGVQPHPWAMVVYFLDRGIKKLRAVQAQVNPIAFAKQTILWRGMKNMELDLVEFKQKGGTELAPMSTTTNEEVARHYAKSEVPLILKYPVSGLRTGVSIQFLSLYPKEEEFLYPPLTYMTFKRSFEDDDTTIIVVEPVMS